MNLPTVASIQNAINKIVGSKAAYADLRELLDQIGESHDAEKNFSTILNPANDGFLNAILKLQRVSGGSERLNNSNLVFISKDEMPCVYKLDFAEGRECYVCHVQMQIQRPVDDRAFIEIGDGCGQIVERLIVGNANVSLARALKSYVVKEGPSCFYSIVITSEKFRLYLNGELLANWKREEAVAVRELRFGLKAKTGATLEASLLNLEVWSSDASLRELTDYEEQAYIEKFNVLLENGELESATRHLHGNSIKLDEDQETEILALTRNEAASGNKGFRDWLFDMLRPSLSENAAKNLDEICEDVRPQPDIVAKNVTVEFLENPAEQFSIKRILQKRENKVFKVLRDVSFVVYPGDRVGVIGQNGVGKSTLLRTITGLIPIKNGEIFVRGEYMLLKAGIGLRNELSGRQNIYHAGAYLGLWGSDLDRICAEVIEFSELGEAIDRPFKFYSDGMKARLVFSLATSVKPDILLLDELLSAGDISFKKKAEGRLENFLNDVRVLVVVSHGIPFVRDKCNKALFLSKHGSSFFGDPEEAISRYLSEVGTSFGQISSVEHLLDADSIEYNTDQF